MSWWSSIQRRRIGIRGRSCQKYALTLFWNAYTLHALVVLIFHGQSTNLHDRSQNGPKLVDKRLSRLISFIHHTCDYKQNYYVGKMHKNAEWGLLQDSDFTGDLEDSQSTSDGTLCVFGSHTFVPISWMCKKQVCVSHRLTDSEIISVDVGLRLDGTPALDFMGSDRRSSSREHASE